MLEKIVVFIFDLDKADVFYQDFVFVKYALDEFDLKFVVVNSNNNFDERLKLFDDVELCDEYPKNIDILVCYDKSKRKEFVINFCRYEVDNKVLHCHDKFELTSKIFFAITDSEAFRFYQLGGSFQERMDLVTVAIATRNQGDVLLGSINSIITQTHRNLEILVLVDASDDNTIEILEELAEKDERIFIFESDVRMHLASAMNFLISKATSNVIVRADTDDYSSPFRIERQVEKIFKNRSLTIVGCDVFEVGGNVKPRVRENPKGSDLELIRKGILPVMHGTWAFRKGNLHKAGSYYSDKMIWAEDLEFAARIVLSEGVFGKVSQPLYFRVFKENSSSISDIDLKNEMRQLALKSLEPVSDYSIPKRDRKLILHLCNSLDFGGTTTFVLDLIRCFPDYRHVVVFANEPSIEFSSYFHEEGVEVVIEKPFSKEISQYYKPDLVIINNPNSYLDKGFFWKKSIVIHHDFTTPFVKADYHIFNSKFTRAQFGDRGDIDEEIIHPPVDINRFKPLVAKNNIPVFGRVSSVNNVQKFPAGYLEIIDKVDGCNFHIHGGRSFYEKHHLAEKNSDKIVFLQSKVDEKTILEYYQGFDIFLYHILPRKEGFGRTITEAMSCGLPIIADFEGGIIDQVVHGWNGFLCRSLDEFVFCCNLLKDNQKLRKKMGENSRRRASKYFSMKKFENKFKRIFQKIDI